MLTGPVPSESSIKSSPIGLWSSSASVTHTNLVTSPPVAEPTAAPVAAWSKNEPSALVDVASPSNGTGYTSASSAMEPVIA